MAEEFHSKQPGTFDELEQALDKDAPVSNGEGVSEKEDHLPPPDPRASSAHTTTSGPAIRPASQEAIDEADLKAAASGTEDTGDDQVETPPLDDNSLHVEADPAKPKPRFWRRKRFWFSFVFLLFLGLALAWFIRPSRMFIVNTLGLKGEVKIATMTLPESGQQPAVVKKVSIEINGTRWETDAQGTLTAKVPFANTKIVAKKAGYETAEREVMVDFDPFFYLLGGRQKDESDRDIKLQLKAVGLPVKFQAKDWLTDQPVAFGAFSVGEVVAKPDNQGVVSITIPATDDKKVVVKALFGGKYLDKEFELPLDGSQPSISFVPMGKEYFMSSRSGKLAVYSSDIDGNNVTEVVAPSPLETAAMNIAISPSGKYGVLASARDGKRDAQGTLLQRLYVIDLSNKKLTPVDEGQWFNFADWAGDTLAYTAGERRAGAAGNSQRLASIDAATNKRTDLGVAASYGALRVAFGSVLYQVNVPPNDPAAANSPEQRVVAIKGGTERSIGSRVQRIAQIDPERFVFQTGDGAWQEYNANKSQIKPASAPATPDRVYLSATTADGQNRLIIDRADGKPALIARTNNGQEKIIYSAAGIRGPFRIVDDIVIFRVVDGGQSADFAISMRGGTPKKIMDVTSPPPPFAQDASYISLF